MNTGDFIEELADLLFTTRQRTNNLNEEYKFIRCVDTSGENSLIIELEDGSEFKLVIKKKK
jgi:hypothetical protein